MHAFIDRLKTCGDVPVTNAEDSQAKNETPLSLLSKLTQLTYECSPPA